MTFSRNHAPMYRTYLIPALLLLTSWRAEANDEPQLTQPSTLQTPAQRTDRYYDNRQTAPAATATPNPLPVIDATHGHALKTTARIHLTAVSFSHSAYIDEAALQTIAAPYVGKDAGEDEINHIVDGVNALYAKRGITTARAVLEKQDLAGGVLQVTLIEGHLGKIVIKGNKRSSDAFIRRRVDTPDGALLDTNQLRDDLVWINRTTDLNTAALLQPGAEVGQTDVLLQVTEPALRSLDVFLDNAGVDTSGRMRLGLAGHYDGLFGVDDRADMSIEKSHGGTDGQISYGALVNASNGRLSGSYSRSQIDIISGAYQALNIVGHSSVAAIQYDQPFIATQHWLLSANASVSQIRSSTSISGTGVADNITNAGSLGITLNHRSDGQEWTLTQNASHLNASQPVDGKGTAWTAVGNFDGVQQLWSSGFALKFDAGWQIASTNRLASASLFQVGGPGSVRGYERGVVAGTEGYYADLELHHALPHGFDTYLFGDHGAVFAAFPKQVNVTGGGVGVIWHYGSLLSFNGDIARSFTKVIPDQNEYRFDFRMAVHFE